MPSELSLSELFGVELYPLFGVLFANMGRSVWARDAAVNLKCVAVLALLALASPLSASAEPPPTCPKGSGPVKVVDAVAGTRASESHWECREGEFWPTGMFLDESDCPKGTHLEQSREDVCVPPAPQCGPKSAPLLAAQFPAGWLCDPQQDCPPGTAAGWSPIQGWQCDNKFAQICTEIREPAPCESNSGCKWVVLHQGATIPDDFPCLRGARGLSEGDQICRHGRG